MRIEEVDFAPGSPKEVLRKAFEVNLIRDDVWREMLKVRSEISHDYDGKAMEEHCNSIVSIYMGEFYELQDVVHDVKMVEWLIKKLSRGAVCLFEVGRV